MIIYKSPLCNVYRINKDNFNKYLESKMNDKEFIKQTFNKIFANQFKVQM